LLCARLEVPKLLFRRAFRGGSLQILDILGVLLLEILLPEVLLLGSLCLVLVVLLQIGYFDLIGISKLVDLYLVDLVDLVKLPDIELCHLLWSYALFLG
jgi:hypothetical protein